MLNSEKDRFPWAGGERGLALDWAQVGFPHHGQLRGSAPGQGVRLGDALPLFFYFSFFIPPAELNLGAAFRVPVAGVCWGRAHPQAGRAVTLPLGKSLAGLHSGDVLLCVLP